VQSSLDLDRAAFVLPDGRIDLRKLLTDFAAFWQEQGVVSKTADFSGLYDLSFLPA